MYVFAELSNYQHHHLLPLVQAPSLVEYILPPYITPIRRSRRRNITLYFLTTTLKLAILLGKEKLHRLHFLYSTFFRFQL